MSTPTTTMLLGSTLPPHLSGASPTTYYCGNMVWQSILENGKKIFDQKNKAPAIAEKTNAPAFSPSSYNELHEVAFLDSENERMVVENAPYENLNTRDHNGNTPLMWAASQGNEHLVEALLDQVQCRWNNYFVFSGSFLAEIEKGALVNMQNFVGETALYIAAARGFDRICALLIEHGGDARYTTVDGASPVHIAAASGHLEVLKTLISKGAFVNAVDEEGDSALHYAIREGQRAAVELLVKHFGADGSIKNEDLESPLDLAIELGEDAIAEFLSKFQATANAMEMSDHPLYFGEMEMNKKEQQAQVDEFIRTSRSVPIY